MDNFPTTATTINNLTTSASSMSNIQTTMVAPVDTTNPTRITDLAITEVTSSSITIQWTEMGDNVEVVRFDVRYSDSTLSALNFDTRPQASGVPEPSGVGTVHTLVIDGLASATQYRVAIKSFDAAGNGSLISNVPVDTTL